MGHSSQNNTSARGTRLRTQKSLTGAQSAPFTLGATIKSQNSRSLSRHSLTDLTQITPSVTHSPPRNYVSPPKESPFRSFLRVSCQSSTEPTSHTAFSPPSYRGRSERGILVYDTGDIYGPIKMAPVVNRTPIGVGRLVIAASHESNRSRKQLKKHKSQLGNLTLTQVEEFGITTENAFSSDLLEEIFTISGSSKCGTTRGMFHSVGCKVSDA